MNVHLEQAIREIDTAHAKARPLAPMTPAGSIRSTCRQVATIDRFGAAPYDKLHTAIAPACLVRLCAKSAAIAVGADGVDRLRIVAKAEANLARWGMQNHETLVLAMYEEAGELAQAYLQAMHERGSWEQVAIEASDLAALAYQHVAHTIRQSEVQP